MQQIGVLKAKVNTNGNNANNYVGQIQTNGGVSLQALLEPALQTLTENSNTVIRDVDVIQSELENAGNHHIVEACISYAPINEIKSATTATMQDQMNTSGNQMTRFFAATINGINGDMNSVATLETLLDQCSAVEPGTEEACYNNVSAQADNTGNDAITNILKKVSDAVQFSNTLVPYTQNSLNIYLGDAVNRQNQALQTIRDCVAAQSVIKV